MRRNVHQSPTFGAPWRWPVVSGDRCRSTACLGVALDRAAPCAMSALRSAPPWSHRRLYGHTHRPPTWTGGPPTWTPHVDADAPSTSIYETRPRQHSCADLRAGPVMADGLGEVGGVPTD